MKKVCVIGNFSGRNAGDAAILEGLLHDVSAVCPEAMFYIPTISTSFVERSYNGYSIKPVSLLPWNLSFKILGAPIFNTALNSDLILLTDAILFDRKLLNPLYNYLSTMAIVLPLAKKRNIPVFLYNVSLGPITSTLGQVCLARVLESAEMVILRDSESIEILNQWQLRHDCIKMGADCALNVTPIGAERLQQIKGAEGILNGNGEYLSFNISSYLDVFVKGKRKGIDKELFVEIIAATMDRIVAEMKKKIVFVITQPMDLQIAERVLAKLRFRDGVTLLSNKTYSHNDLAGIFAQVEMHVGMRTHSLILASSACTPTVGIIATPKNRGYMKSIEQDRRMIEFDERFTADNLFRLIQQTWEQRAEIRQQLVPIMEREKQKARGSAQYLRPYLG